tara:strand:- start:490 stop:711 length:222 start_codon:yes stop_codon:yes gene_type:complete
MSLREYILVISMWGSDGSTDHYIGQMALQQPMTEKQCLWMLEDKRWSAAYDNSHYTMAMHCFPKDCAGKSICE